MHQFITIGLGIVLPHLLIGTSPGHDLGGQLHINAPGAIKKVCPHLDYRWQWPS